MSTHARDASGGAAEGSTYVDRTNLHPFSPEGSGGVLAATGIVFVSYAGVFSSSRFPFALGREIGERLAPTVLLVHSRLGRSRTFVRDAVGRLGF